MRVVFDHRALTPALSQRERESNLRSWAPSRDPFLVEFADLVGWGIGADDGAALADQPGDELFDDFLVRCRLGNFASQ